MRFVKVLRTPDDRFQRLPGFDFEPHYVEVPAPNGETLRMHYLDEGRSEGPPVVMLHGQPSWSYLYRAMIPRLTQAGLRVLAPDLIGFGRSDKPVERSDYTYQRHIDWISAWLAAVDPAPATLFLHDWGGFIGLRVVAALPERFVRVVVSNTGLPDVERLKPPEIFYTWRQFVRDQKELRTGNVIQLGTTSELPEAVVAAYDAPFPDESYKSGVRAFPELVPTERDHPEAAANREAWKVLEQFERPFLTLFGELDPMNAGSDRVFQERVPGARGQPHALLPGAGHYIQEDAAHELTDRLLRFLSATETGVASCN
jgi:haloalkane dehalogenase